MLYAKFLTKYKYLLLYFSDFGAIYLAGELACYSNGYHLFSAPYENYASGITFIGLSHLVLLTMSGFYRVAFSAFSLELVLKGARGLIMGNFLSLILFQLFIDSASPLKLLLPFWSFEVILIFSYRVLYRIYREYGFLTSIDSSKPTVFVYGAGSIGEQLTRLQRKDKLSYRILCLFDDNPQKKDMSINGIKVCGGMDIFIERLGSVKPSFIVVAIANFNDTIINDILGAAEEHDIPVKIVPRLFELEQHNKSVIDIRDVDVSDLLGRKSITIDKEPINELIRDKVVLVTGAGGSIGSEISRQIKEYGANRLILLDIDETEIHNLSLELNNYETSFTHAVEPVVCDIRSKSKFRKILEHFQPDIIFHAAAYKHVPLMEYYPQEAVNNNIYGTYNVLSAAIEYEISRVIIISTDKAVNPTNIMGATKRISELVGTKLSNDITSIVSVRFGNVLGSRGSVLPLFLDQIQKGLPTTVTHKDMIRFFMTIPEAVSLVFLAGAIGKGGEVLVLDMGKPVKIYDFAEKLIKKYGNGRSKVKISGLRPGEKLYEEVLTAEEGTSNTHYSEIYKAKISNVLNGTPLDVLVQQFLDASPPELHKLFLKYIPTYHHKWILDNIQK